MSEPLLSKPKVVTSRDLDYEEAETCNLKQVEEDTLLRHSTDPSSSRSDERRVHDLFRSAARHVIFSKRKSSTGNNPNGNSSRNIHTSSFPGGGGDGRRNYRGRSKKSTAAELLDQIMEAEDQEDQDGYTPVVESGTEMARAAVFRSAGIHIVSDTSTIATENVEVEETADDSQTLPQYGSIAPTNDPPTSAGPRTTFIRWSKSTRNQGCWKGKVCIPKCNICHLARHIYEVIVTSYLFKLALPLFVATIILYYVLDNPRWYFIPGQQSLSWMCNFLARQVVTFELARFTQWLLLDCILLGSYGLSCVLGTFATMTAVQSRGWPFVVTAWACWDLLLLHGSGQFQSHWLYWTGWNLFSNKASSGQFILTSEVYLSFLLSMILAGVFTTAKRMFLTIQFGKRMLGDFKPKLEALLADMVIVSEIADLAQVSEKLDEAGEFGETGSAVERGLQMQKTMQKRLWTSVKYLNPTSSFDSNEVEQEEEEEKKATDNDKEEQGQEQEGMCPHLSRSRSGSVQLKKLLENWDEPKSKLDKTGEATIQDVLKFKHALDYMDEQNPFGTSFGNASNRDEAIASSHSIFYKLLKWSPKSKDLPFEVLSWITFDENETQDNAKLQALQRLFRPDAQNNLPLLAFVHSCDMVYKRFRYFRATVCNASVIDRQIEAIANWFFGLLLALMVLLVMKIDPWPVLLSMTSLLVSLSFAMGATISKYVEGICLIAVRRPFDLGDRILINSTESADSPGGPMGWFVEDITLSSTTLRFSKSNEVATVSNYAISQSKIVNCARSPSAVIFFKLKVSRKILEGDNLNILREELQAYARDRPRVWECLLFIRQDYIEGVCVEPESPWASPSIENETPFVILSVCFKHRKSWQATVPIMISRGELFAYIFGVCKRIGIEHDDMTPHQIQIENVDARHGLPGAMQPSQSRDPFFSQAGI